MPLANSMSTIGFDINERRVTELKRGIDSNNELTAEQFEESLTLEFSDEEQLPAKLRYLHNHSTNTRRATESAEFRAGKKGNPLSGLPSSRREISLSSNRRSIPERLKKSARHYSAEISGLGFNTDFHVGYSPERINPWRFTNTH